MSMLLVHELHEARDRILLLCSRLQDAQSRELPAYSSFLEEQIRILKDALGEAKIPEQYRVAVVGRFKVGKSSFVNKLAKEKLAGVDTNPETAAISIFRYDTVPRAEIKLVSSEEWERMRKDHESDPNSPELERYEKFVTFNERTKQKPKDGHGAKRENVDLNELSRNWIHAGGRSYVVAAPNWETKSGKKEFLSAILKFTSSKEPLHFLVNQLTIYAPIPLLRDNIELIDTPGLDDSERYRVQLTEELVKDVDAILFLTVSGASYSQSDKDFIIRQLRRRQVKHLQIIVTKCDETFENACRDAKDSDESPPTFEQFAVRESNRIKAETKATLEELLKSSQLTDEEGYYFIEQLDDVPVHLISTKYHEDGNAQNGGIEAVRDGLYKILSSSNRFEQSRSILTSRLETVLERLRKHYSDRFNTLSADFDPAKVREEIEAIRASLSKRIETFEERSGEAQRLLENDQEAQFEQLPLHLEVFSIQAREVLHDLEKGDLALHWRSRRYGNWGYLADLQDKIADRVFPKVESFLNVLCKQLDSFMDRMDRELSWLQHEMDQIESEHQLVGIEPIALSELQRPFLQELSSVFRKYVQESKDGIVTNLDDFVSTAVQSKLDETREEIADTRGTGTSKLQAAEVSRFYSEIRFLLANALIDYLKERIEVFANAIKKQATSVVPRVKEQSENAIQDRLNSIASSLQVATEGRRETVKAYLTEMVGIVSNFGAEPSAKMASPELQLPSSLERSDTKSIDSPRDLAGDLNEQHYEIWHDSRLYCNQLRAHRAARRS